MLSSACRTRAWLSVELLDDRRWAAAIDREAWRIWRSMMMKRSVSRIDRSSLSTAAAVEADDAVVGGGGGGGDVGDEEEAPTPAGKAPDGRDDPSGGGG